jgi:hypothetical protein
METILNPIARRNFTHISPASVNKVRYSSNILLSFLHIPRYVDSFYGKRSFLFHPLSCRRGMICRCFCVVYPCASCTPINKYNSHYMGVYVKKFKVHERFTSLFLDDFIRQFFELLTRKFVFDDGRATIPVLNAHFLTRLFMVANLPPDVQVRDLFLEPCLQRNLRLLRRSQALYCPYRDNPCLPTPRLRQQGAS